MDYNSADLTSVLRTLSALSNQQQQPPPPPPPAIATIQNNATQSHKLEQQAAAAAKEEQENDPYEPSESLPHISVAPTPAPAPTAPTAPSTPSQTQSHHPNTASSQPSHGNRTTEDTSTITTWPTALRYVMRTVAQNESIQQRIRWLMQRQYDHEKQWWQGREALLRKQASRIEKKKELDAVLRSVGAPVDENKQISVCTQRTTHSYTHISTKRSRERGEAITVMDHRQKPKLTTSSMSN
ncbi:hypothetical protein BO94DRAFT_538044 [Aspergillus sclerotioniger CBS 115572]|uniref:Uncharacterized protein n=1 Tax=Aspergillus sclerotioniger CBS 115572 TaxID=1450535 RepID=A0A317VS07_9EURO|nr:hypothetical protein BO94DRAFT_538044 [Aspergillus sclerotioniger CBS 115572]PWY77184.1 hypothetical protein BO94DRAFT_538044 [Aspergillus sclerotioniger CBS 115572]